MARERKVAVSSPYFKLLLVPKLCLGTPLGKLCFGSTGIA
jgi:hypothetical protein